MNIQEIIRVSLQILISYNIIKNNEYLTYYTQHKEFDLCELECFVDALLVNLPRLDWACSNQRMTSSNLASWLILEVSCDTAPGSTEATSVSCKIVSGSCWTDDGRSSTVTWVLIEWVVILSFVTPEIIPGMIDTFNLMSWIA